MQRQRSSPAPAKPHGQGLVEATSISRVGKTATCCPRTIVTRPSSSGWRSASRLERGNSRQLVEEQDAEVGEGRLAGRRQRAAARPDRTGRSCGAARGTGARATSPRPSWRPATLWMRGDLDRLVVASAAAGSRAAGARASSCRCPAGPRAAGCDRRRRRPRARVVGPACPRTSARSGPVPRGKSVAAATRRVGRPRSPLEQCGRSRRLADPGDLDPVDERGLRGLVARGDQALEAGAPCALGHGQRAAARPQLAAEPELAEHRPAIERAAGTWPLAARTPAASRGRSRGRPCAGTRARGWR